MKRLARALIDGLSWFFAALGPKRAVALGRALGVFAFYVVPIRRGIVLDNLARAFPGKSAGERWQIARGVYRQLGRILAETMFLPRLEPQELARLMRFQNVEVLDAGFAQGKGVVFCLSHMGNWELFGFEGSRRGYRFHAITKVLKGAFNEAILVSRKKYYGELPPSGSFERGMEVLADGQAVALAIDQHRGGDKAVVIDFFGRPASTSPAPALFAIRSGAPVISGWVSLGPDDVYDVWFRGPHPVPEAATLAERLQLHTQALHADLEGFIREHPSEWYWVHRRWKVPERRGRS